MPRGDVNKNACSHCRTKRKKCNSNVEIPCSTCRADHTECVFADKRQKSKAELKGEVARLSKSLRYTSSILQRLRSGDDTDAVLSSLKRGDTIENIAGQIYQSSIESPDNNASSTRFTTPSYMDCESSSSGLVSHSAGDGEPHRGFDVEQPACSVHHSETTGSKMPSPSFMWESQFTSMALGDEADTTAPRKAFDSELGTTLSPGWINAPFSNAAVARLFDVFFTHGFFPIVDRESFERDHNEGSGPYCSRALVNIILALASRLSEDALEVPRREDERTPAWSKTFFHTAMRLLKNEGSNLDLPDIQAVALCSLYQLCAGYDNEAQTLADQSLDFITWFIEAEGDMAIEDEDHWNVRDTTICGAISLSRMTAFAVDESRRASGTSMSDRFHSKSLSTPLKDYVSSDQRTITYHQMAVESQSHGKQPFGNSGMRDMYNHFHRLTELAYLVDEPTDANLSSGASNSLLETYHQCLEWYDAVSSLLHAEDFICPFTVFIDLHYHFCLLMLWRPSMTLKMNNTQASPRDICYDASKAILTLTASSRDFTHIQPVPYYIPYFIHAAGALQLALLQGVTTASSHVIHHHDASRTDGRSLLSTAISQLDQIKLNSKFSSAASKNLSNGLNAL